MQTKFNSEFYPYYALLSSYQKSVYELILPQILQLNDQISITGLLKSQDMYDILTSIYYDHPEIFWFDGSCTVNTRNGFVISVQPGYTAAAWQVPDLQHRLDLAIKNYLAQIPKDSSAADQELLIHDMMVEMTTYQRSANDQNAYGALCEKKAVCAGYSRAFQLIMHRLGIICYYCSGQAKSTSDREWGNHAWNIIRLGNDFYNMDLTWDDCYDKTAPDRISYTYYNCTDSFMASTHQRSSFCKGLPACRGTRYSFRKQTGIAPELDLIYQDGVTCKLPVESLHDFQKQIIPVLRQMAGRPTELSFPVRGQEVFQQVLDMSDTSIRDICPKNMGCSWRKSTTDYHNGWYRVELSIQYR